MFQGPMTPSRAYRPYSMLGLVGHGSYVAPRFYGLFGRLGGRSSRPAGCLALAGSPFKAGSGAETSSMPS